ncbi:MAG: FAD-binding oxidoreductase [Dehalococcoidia bacterium]
MDKELVRKLGNIVGQEHITDEPFELCAYARAWSYELHRRPEVVVVPGSTEEVSEIMKLANETATPVNVRAGGTTNTGAAIPREGGITLDLNRLSGPIHLDEDCQTFSAQAGVTVYKIIKDLYLKGWKIPWRPEFGSAVTIGGWVNFNGTGVGASVYGRVGDFLVGLQVVLPTGEIVTTGSSHFGNAKRFTRYQGTGPDLTGLFLESLGTMGVITEVYMRMYRIPEAEGQIDFAFDDEETLQNAIRALVEANISYAICVTDEQMCLTNRLPGAPGKWLLTMIAEGWQEEVDFRLRKGREILNEVGGREFPPEQPRAEWGAAASISLPYEPSRRQVSMGGFHNIGITKDIFDTYNRIGEKYGLQRGMGWWVEQNYCNQFPIYVYDEEADMDMIFQAVEELHSEWIKAGYAPDYPGPFPNMTPHIARPYLELYRRVKKMIDPNNIMHRGMKPDVED